MSTKDTVQLVAKKTEKIDKIKKIKYAFEKGLSKSFLNK